MGRENLLKYTVSENEIGERLDKFLSLKLNERTRSFIQKAIAENEVTVNNKAVNKNYRVTLGDEVCVLLSEPKILEAKPQNIPLNIVYEDKDVLVVNKQKGMVVHPANGHPDGTLVNALLHHCKDLSGINGVLRPGIVHRIDKDTSGLLMVAKNDFAHLHLSEQIKAHSFNREYEAVVYACPKSDSGQINAPIGRHPVKRKQMAVFVPNAKEAITEYKILQRYDGFTHMRLKLYTGRTHQIRVHMAYIGCPVAGDVVYGVKKVIKSLNGQCLHAKLLGFVHPRTQKYMEFETDLPEYFKKFIKNLR